MTYSIRGATTPRQTASDRFAVDIDNSWDVLIGPNGGLITAALVRAAQARFSLPVRTLTAHFMRPPIGPVEATITTREIRAGRTITTAALELWAHDKLCITSLVALGHTRDSPVYDRARRDVGPVPSKWATVAPDDDTVRFRRYWNVVPTMGVTAPDPNADPIVGGWMRPSNGERIDAATAAAALDGWWPALFNVMPPPGQLPTIDLTVHFRTGDIDCAALHLEATSSLLAEGYLDEDARVWSEDGRLIAHSRQLAAFFEPTRPRPDLPTESPDEAGGA